MDTWGKPRVCKGPVAAGWPSSSRNGKEDRTSVPLRPPAFPLLVVWVSGWAGAPWSTFSHPLCPSLLTKRPSCLPSLGASAALSFGPTSESHPWSAGVAEVPSTHAIPTATGECGGSKHRCLENPPRAGSWGDLPWPERERVLAPQRSSGNELLSLWALEGSWRTCSCAFSPQVVTYRWRCCHKSAGGKGGPVSGASCLGGQSLRLVRQSQLPAPWAAGRAVLISLEVRRQCHISGRDWVAVSSVPGSRHTGGGGFSTDPGPWDVLCGTRDNQPLLAQAKGWQPAAHGPSLAHCL